jgi:tRNA(Ile)-lysidine synthetase-like protein
MKKYTLSTSIIDSNLNIRYPVIVGVSGGIDSMVLLDALIQHNYDVIVCHVNHGLRDSSDFEESYVRDYALKKNLKFESIKLDLSTAKNIQDAAHQKRIAFFKAMGHKYQTFQIALAHHLDDQFEQHLISLVRGTHLDTWKAMSNSSVIDDFLIIRPFLNNTKQDIIDYANLYDVVFINDESNQSNNYLRNRIRNHVVPYLKSENPKILENFNNNLVHLTLILEDNRIQKLINQTSKKSINYLTFIDESSYTQTKLLRFLIQDFDSKLRITQPTIEMIRKQLVKSGDNVRFQLKDNTYLVCNYGKIKVIKTSDHIPDPIVIDSPGKYSYGSNKILFVSYEKKPHNTDKVIEICYNESTFPLIVRPPLPGDKIQFKYGHKKISRIFQDYKVPLHQRIYQTIIEHQSKLLGVLSLSITSECNQNHSNKLYIYEVDDVKQ